MAEYIKRIEAKAIYGRFDLTQEFQSGVNIIYGRNGAGKTTLLHIIANILNGDYKRFAFLIFNTIEAHIDDDTIIVIKRTVGKREIVEHVPIEREGGQIDIKEEKQQIEIPIITVHNNGVLIQEFSVSDARKQEREVRMRDARNYRVFMRQEVENLKPLLPCAYFPAFRTMIEAWALKEDIPNRKPLRIEEGLSLQTQATIFARGSFGDFVPVVNYPSPIDIESILISEIQLARLQVAKTDSELLSQVFLDVFASLSLESRNKDQEEPDSLLDSIQQLSEKLEELPFLSSQSISSGIYTKLREIVHSFQTAGKLLPGVAPKILEVYQKSLAKRVEVQKAAFERIERYLNSVNQFLEDSNCKIEINVIEHRKQASTMQQTSVALNFKDGFTGELKTLSSGERQIVTLVYAATHMSAQKVVLIDEPEISLHIDWQRKLLLKMSEQLGSRQIIACTHSPTIGADYEDRVIELTLQPTESPVFSINEQIEDEEIPF